MPRSVVPRLMLCAGLLAGIMVVGRAGETPSIPDVWQQVSTYLTKEALLSLKDLPPAGNADEQREYDFCAAVVVLDQQPLSEARLDDVTVRLKDLVSAGMNDEVDRAACYLLGRIAQIYRAEPDVTLAANYYRDLIARAGPGHWADIARVKLAVLILYALPADSPAGRVAQVEALIPGTTDSLAVRDLHRVAGRAVMFYNLRPEEALRHLLAADEIGGLIGTLGADQLVQIGELAWDTGEVELATKYYQRLETDYPRDPRIFLMNQRLAGNPMPKRREQLHGR